jgi:hypothetical protein
MELNSSAASLYMISIQNNLAEFDFMIFAIDLKNGLLENSTRKTTMLKLK